MTSVTRTIVQVCPEGQGGVRDFADHLAAQWRLPAQAPTPPLTLSAASARERSLALRIDDRVAPGASVALVLHYSGYGYGRRGLCGWLLDELDALKKPGRDGVRLVVVFHELFATGAPWRSAFWLSAAQASIARAVARRADAVWTNTGHHARWLRAAIGPAVPMGVHAVFSNVGEPAAAPDGSRRQAQAVVFGARSTRERALRGLRGQVPQLRRLGVDALVEVGDGPGCATPALVGDLPCRHAGRLAAPALQALLLESRFGLLEYPARFLGKSGVFAAYAAHGCAVINTGRPERAVDGLAPGRDYLDLRHLPAEPAAIEPAQIAARLSAWYAPHRLECQAAALRALADGAPPLRA